MGCRLARGRVWRSGLYFVCSLIPARLVAVSQPVATCADWSLLPRTVGATAIPGDIPAIALQEPLAFVATESGLMIDDVSFTGPPRLVGNVDLGLPVVGIAVSGTRAYVTTTNGLWVMTLEDPESPDVRGHAALHDSWRAPVVASGSIACVGMWDGHIGIFDAADPDSIAQLAEFRGSGWLTPLALHGDLLLLGDSVEGLLVLKVTDPGSPTVIGRLAILDGRASAADFVGKVLCLGVSRGYGQVGALWTVDLSVLESPRVLARASTWGPTVSAIAAAEAEVIVVTGFCTTQCGGFSLQLFDLSDVRSPSNTADVRLEGIGEDVALTSGRAFAVSSACNPNRGGCDGSGGLFVVEIPDGTASALGERLDLDHGGWRVAVRDPRGIAADGRGVTTFSLADPGRPQTSGWVRSPIFPLEVRDLDLDGDLACVAADTNGVLVIDSSDPKNPRVVTLAYTPGRAHGISLERHLAFVAVGFSGLLVLDLADLSAPRYVGLLPTGGQALDVVVRDGYAYLVDQEELVVIDVHLPAAPRIVGRLDAPGGIHVAVEGGLAFVTAGWPIWKVHIVDITDPETPRLRSSIDHSSTEPVVPRGNLLYVPSSFTQMVDVLDVGDPAIPRPCGHLEYGGSLSQLVSGADYLYAAAVVHWRNTVQVFIPQCMRSTATLEWNFEASSGEDGVSLTWDVRGTALAGLHVRRFRHGTSTWERLTARSMDPHGPGRFLDTTVSTDWTCDYQLEGVLGSGAEVFSPTLTIDRASAGNLRISVPNPSHGSVEMVIRTSRREDARTLVFDVGGRTIRRLDCGILEPGVQRIRWDGRDDRGGAAASGVYFVEVRTDRESEKATIVFLR